MEIRVLKYFLTVAREGSITRAAEILHVTQPTLSRQILELERETGVKLLDRGSRHVSLTSDGLLLKRRAEEIVDLVDKTEKELSGNKTVEVFLIKEISVVSAIALPDLMYVTKDLIGNSYKTDESLILLVSAYVVLLLPISLLGYWLEKKVRYAGFGN